MVKKKIVVSPKFNFNWVLCIFICQIWQPCLGRSGDVPLPGPSPRRIMSKSNGGTHLLVQSRISPSSSNVWPGLMLVLPLESTAELLKLKFYVNHLGFVHMLSLLSAVRA